MIHLPAVLCEHSFVKWLGDTSSSISTEKKLLFYQNIQWLCFCFIYIKFHEGKRKISQQIFIEPLPLCLVPCWTHWKVQKCIKYSTYRKVREEILESV